MAAGGTTGGTIGGLIGGMPGIGIGSSIGTVGGALLAPRMEREGGKIAAKLLEATKGIRTPQAIQPQGRISSGIQNGVRGSLLDEFLNQNRREVERNEFLRQNQNRVK